MSKAKIILSAAAVMAGALGGPGLMVMASTEPALYSENTYDEIFRVMRLDPYAGLMRLRLDIPKEQVLRRIVVARPDEDRYRLMSELDAAALGILDGNAKGLVVVESSLGVGVTGRVVDDWAGFYEYDGGGLRLLKRNPADVMYAGMILQDTKTGEESRRYYKVNYRTCAHEQAIMTEEVTICDVKHADGKTVFVPETRELTGNPPTWEEELAALARETVQEDFEELEAFEAMKAGGGEIKAEQIEELKARGEKMGFAKFPEMDTIGAIKTDYLARVEALGKVTGGGQGTQVPSQGSSQEPSREPSQEPEEPSRIPQGSSESGAPSVALGVQSDFGIQSTKKVQSTKEPQVVIGVQNTDSASAGDNLSEDQAPKIEIDTSAGDQEEVAVPKLGGSWLERYWLAVTVAGASLTGAVGWFLIGLVAKKRKRNER